MVQLVCVYATTQVTTRNNLAMSQIRHHSTDSNTNFDLTEEGGFGLVWSVIREFYVHELLILWQIKPQTHGNKLPFVQGIFFMSCVSDPWAPLF